MEIVDNTEKRKTPLEVFKEAVSECVDENTESFIFATFQDREPKIFFEGRAKDIKWLAETTNAVALDLIEKGELK